MTEANTLLAEAIASGQAPASAVVEHHEAGEYEPKEPCEPHDGMVASRKGGRMSGQEWKDISAAPRREGVPVWLLSEDGDVDLFMWLNEWESWVLRGVLLKPDPDEVFVAWQEAIIPSPPLREAT